MLQYQQNLVTVNKLCLMHVNIQTFISTDSLSFSRLTIFIATFFPVTQWTPSLTRPEKIKVNHIDSYTDTL